MKTRSHLSIVALAATALLLVATATGFSVSPLTLAKAVEEIGARLGVGRAAVAANAVAKMEPATGQPPAAYVPASDAFHFLSPIGSSGGDSSRFDPSLLNHLTVEICRVAGSECTLVRSFDSRGTNQEQLRIERTPRDGSYYIVNWDTDRYPLNRHVYRVRAAVPGLQLGSIDLGPDRYNTFGRTWPIKFRIEANPVIRTRIMRSTGKSASQVASALRNEFNLSPEEVALRLAGDLVPYSQSEIDLAIRGVFQPAVIPDTTKITDEATRRSLISFNPATGVMIFSTDTPLVRGLRPGDVLVSEPGPNAPNGYLRKVTSNRRANGQFVFETSQASINDAIRAGSLEASVTLSPSDLERAETEFAGVTVSTLSSEEPAAFGAQSIISEGYNFATDFDITLDGTASGGGVSGTGHVRIQGSIRFNAGYDIGFGAEPCVAVPPVCIDRFEARMGVEQYSRVRVTGTFDGTLHKEVRLATHYFKPIVFFIGPVPVVLVPVVNAVVGVNGDAHVTFRFETDLSTRLTVGAKWTDSQGWQSLLTRNPIEHRIIDRHLDANMHLRAYGKGDAKLLFYGVAGPGFAAQLGGGIDVQVPRRPWWRIFGHIGASVNFQVDFGGVLKLSEYSVPILNENFNLLDAPNEAPRFINVRSGAIPARLNTPVNIGPGGGFGGHNYDVTDLEGDPITLSATASPDGTVTNSPLRVTFPTIGLKTVVITARDPSGATSTLTLGVDVRNSPPNITVTPNSGEVAAATQFWVKASAYDPEEGTLRCSRLRWGVSAPDTIAVSSDNSSCSAVVKFNQQGTRSITVSATDSQGATISRTVNVNVTPPPANRLPEIEIDSFSIEAVSVYRRRGDNPFELGCFPGFLCEVPDGALLHNGQAGDFVPPLIMRLNVSDPDGDPVAVQWHCLTGSQAAPVTNNGDGSYGCTPFYSATEPIMVFAVVGPPPPPFGDTNMVIGVSSEKRTFFMLGRVN